MNNNNTLTYISLFSSAGVGCYGFKLAGYECIATNELIDRRLNVQRINGKCKYDTGYIPGDITKKETKDLIFKEIERWNKQGRNSVDVVIATPPCQGMSVANHKKSDNEIVRNSLVVESIKIVKEILPKFFVFENVSAFMKTGCTAPDGTVKAIGNVIFEELSEDYLITSRVINFKNYGSNSSRTRTIVIGVNKFYEDYVAPIELYPQYKEEKLLKDVIGDLPSLEWGEISENDFYHQFRTYPQEMREWIHGLKEGEGAFDNEDPLKRPHQVVDGKIVQNKQKNGDKYTRQYWNKVAPCIHTRNDQLASQNTIHPHDDRVFSIRELMQMMTIPNTFKWVDLSLEELNALSYDEKVKILKKEEVNIRQSIGEAVPTNIFYQIANNIKDFILKKHITNAEIDKIISNNDLFDKDKLFKYIDKNSENLDYASLSKIVELTNNKRESNAAYYTNKFLVSEIVEKLPTTDKQSITILEPSVGAGNFLLPLFRKYEDVNHVELILCDIDEDALKMVKLLLTKVNVPKNFNITYVCDDFLLHDFDSDIFLFIGNPPFNKASGETLKKYRINNVNKKTSNLFEFFLEKGMSISEHVALVTPKNILNTPEFEATRDFIEKCSVKSVLDFGERGFKGVLIETICLCIDPAKKPGFTDIVSLPKNIRVQQNQKYIFDNKLPYWIIYRNKQFDEVLDKLELDVFNVFRDRQIVNSMLNVNNGIRVLRSRNISDTGESIVDIKNYDSYIKESTACTLSVYDYLNRDDVYLTPNMTYYPRVIKKPKGVLVNGSLAILIPKEERKISKEQLLYFSSNEYRNFYQIARNYQTRSLNIDSCSVYFFGLLKNGD